MVSEEIKTILLVDDDTISNLLNKVFIDKLNTKAEVEIALNGQEALDLLLERQDELQLPCLLLLDIKMPVMNGWEFLEQYEKLISKSAKDKIVIVLLTVSEAQADLIKAQKNPNINEFVRKPLSEKSLSSLISTHFENSNSLGV